MPVYAVRGMSCDHCVHAITEAVRGADPGAVVQIDLPGGRMSVSGGASAPPGAIEAAVADEGYTAHLLG